MSLARDIAVMRRAALLRVFGEEQLKLIAFGSERRPYRRGSRLHEAGEPATGATLILFGQVELQLTAGSAGGRIAGVGALLDGTAMVARGTHGFTAVARVESEVLLIPRTTMARTLSEFPQYAAALRDEIVLQSETLIASLAPVEAALRPR